MPLVRLHPPSASRQTQTLNPLPQLLHTPSGLALVELQGTLNLPEKVSGETEVGRFEFCTDGKVWLYIGKHQRMGGDIKKLPNPLGVLRRRETGDGGNEEVEITEIVSYKVLFKGRPEPVS